MKLAAYAKYKPSNIDWAGDVPADWSLKRVREGAKLINGYPFDSDLFGIGEGLPLVRIRDIASNTTEVTWTGPAIRSARIERGDILVGMDGDFNVARWTGNSAMLNQRVCCVRTKPTELDDRFLFYFLPFPLKTLNDVTYSTTVKHLSSLDLLKFRFYAPNVREQHAIADFLDRETPRLDTLVGKKRELIEKLKEKRNALISRTVTRGLPAEAAAKAGFNPHPNLKPSGIEWLGDIPEHWEATRVGFVVTKIGSGKTPRGGGQTYQTEGVMLIRSQNVYDEGLRLSDVAYIDDETDREMAGTRVVPGDVLLNITGASLGRCAIVPSRFAAANVNQHVCIIRPDRAKVETKFLQFALTMQSVKAQIFADEAGSSREGLNFQQVRNLVIARPSTKEQVTITDYLDRETAKLDRMMEKVEAAIEKLQEYRTALITAAVTGKIDVRNSARAVDPSHHTH